MTDWHEQLDQALEPDDNQDDGDFGVLLQLTLPIVLILAFLVVTEVRSLQEHIDGLLRDLADTETQSLREQRDWALITLQQQFLLKAAEEEVAHEREVTGIDAYAALVPSPAEVLDKRVGMPFRQLSQELSERYGEEGREIRRALYQTSLRRFEDLVQEHREEAGLSPHAWRTLLAVTEENETFLRTELRGRVEGLIGAIANTQLRLVLAWIQEPRAGHLVQAESQRIWLALQSEADDDAVGAGVDRFVNLKVDALERSLAAQKIELLAETRRRVG